MTTAKKIAGAAGSALLLASMGATGAVALADEAPEGAAAVDAPAASVEAERGVSAATRSLSAVEGTFSFTQGDVTPASTIVRAFSNAAAYLCGSAFTGAMPAADNVEGDALSWNISVGGDVQNAFTAPLGELEEEGEAHMIMGCSCAGNPEDGLASVNAEVKGVTIAYILEQAGADADANTIVFTSADGYEVALPLSYVAQRASMIVYDVNGAELGDTIGGTNQLWLGSTSARYFVRNVEKIAVETRDEAPAAPGSPEAGDAYANVPNISMTYGGAAA